MPRKLSIDEINFKKPFGSRITALEFSAPYYYPSGERKRFVKCICLCGNYITVNVGTVVSGNTMSCGCYAYREDAVLAHSIETINENRRTGVFWEAIRFAGHRINGRGERIRLVECKCDCGKIFISSLFNLRTKHTKSCGCWNVKQAAIRFRKYTESISAIKGSYWGMISRCYNSNNLNYHLYGGRGVSVCEEWRGDYQKFLNWSLENGWEPGLQLDKDKKVLGNLVYSPSTCTWLPPYENASYRRNNVKYEYKGEMLTFSQISKRTNIPVDAFKYRILVKKMSIEDAILLGFKKRKTIIYAGTK